MANPLDIDEASQPDFPEPQLRHFEVNLRSKRGGKIIEPDIPEGISDFGVEYNKNKNKAIVSFFDSTEENMNLVKQLYTELSQQAYEGRINSSDYRG